MLKCACIDQSKVHSGHGLCWFMCRVCKRCAQILRFIKLCFVQKIVVLTFFPSSLLRLVFSAPPFCVASLQLWLLLPWRPPQAWPFPLVKDYGMITRPAQIYPGQKYQTPEGSYRSVITNFEHDCPSFHHTTNSP